MCESRALPRVALPLALLLSLSACQWLRPPPPPPVVTEAPPVPVRDAYGEVRKAIEAHRSTVEVVPVDNPAVALALDAFDAALAAGDADAAARRLQVARELEPDNPRVLQAQAEWHLHQREWTQADTYARRSHAAGAQLGQLCARNWHTLAEVRLALGEDDAHERQQATACAIQPLPRM